MRNIRPHLTPFVYGIHHTILAVTISCKGQVGLCKILFYFKTFMHESIIRLLPPPTCTACTIAMLLYVYSAVYDAPPTPSLYTIHHTVLAMAISRKDQ